MKINFKWCRLEELKARELHGVIAVRESVFVVEQKCPYQEADEYDHTSWHLIAYIDEEIAGYLRVVDPKHKYDEPSIGRVLTAQKYRGKGIGKQLLKEGIRKTEETFPKLGIRISAQKYLLDLYKEFGFQQVSEEYLEDDIPHIEMVKN